MDADKEPIDGILVRSDAKKGVIYVRTKPGVPPRSFAVSDIKRIEKGVIRTVGFSSDVTIPEIRQLVIYNGSKKTITYIAPTLSPAELDQLGELESTENELERLEYQSRSEQRTLLDAQAVKSSERATREIANEFLRQYLANRMNYLDAPPTGVQVWAPTTYYGHYGQTIVFDRKQDDAVVAALSILRAGSPVEEEKTIEPVKSTVPASALESARRNYIAARARAVYENGQLVAVFVKDSAVEDAVAPR